MATLSSWRAFSIPNTCIALLFLGGASDRLLSQAAIRGSVESFAADGLQRFRVAEQARRDRAIATDRLVADLKDPLRLRLLALLRDGKRFDAIKEFRAATDADLTTADAVITRPGQKREW